MQNNVLKMSDNIVKLRIILEHVEESNKRLYGKQKDISKIL